jgi:hypothetical protein
VIITASGPDRNSAGQSCGRDSRHAQDRRELERDLQAWLVDCESAGGIRLDRVPPSLWAGGMTGPLPTSTDLDAHRASEPDPVGLSRLAERPGNREVGSVEGLEGGAACTG